MKIIDSILPSLFIFTTPEIFLLTIFCHISMPSCTPSSAPYLCLHAHHFLPLIYAFMHTFPCHISMPSCTPSPARYLCFHARLPSLLTMVRHYPGSLELFPDPVVQHGLVWREDDGVWVKRGWRVVDVGQADAHTRPHAATEQVQVALVSDIHNERSHQIAGKC